ncbi:hypothetical protein BsWGS_17611 [Bradybaena similaris]
MKAFKMASKKLVSNKETAKKKLNEMQLLQNSNSAGFQQPIAKQTDSAAIIRAKPSLAHDGTPTKAHVFEDTTSINRNVNKQLVYSFGKMDTSFLRMPEIPMTSNKSHVTFSENDNLKPNQRNFSDFECIDIMATHSSPAGRQIYDAIIPRTEAWDQSVEDASGQFFSSVEQNRSKEASRSQNLSYPDVDLHEQEQENVSREELLNMPSTEKETNDEVVSDDSCVYKVTEGDREDELIKSLIIQNQLTTTKVKPPDRTEVKLGLPLEYQECPEPFISQFRDEGQIVVHRPYPGIAEGFRPNATVPQPWPRPAQETVCGLWYDDSVFPTKHRLSTSEEMRTAMMQARKQTYYRRTSDAGQEAGLESSFTSDESLGPNYSRFTRARGSDLQVKYRHIMSAMHRRSFNDWKNEISARAGQALDPSVVMGTATNVPLQKFGYPKCLLCHKNVSGIYGKPCSCRQIPYKPASNLCYSNNKTHKRIMNSRSDTHRRVLNINKNMTEFTQSPSPLPKFAKGGYIPHSSYPGEIETGKNTVNKRSLGDTVSESKLGTQVNTIKSSPASRDSQEPELSRDQAGDDSSLARTSDTLKSASSTKESRKVLEDFKMLNPPDRKCRPLREWEINQLQDTLKKCHSEKRGISRSSELSL